MLNCWENKLLKSAVVLFSHSQHVPGWHLEEQLALSGQLNSNTPRCHFSILRNIINKEIIASCHRLPHYWNNNPFLPKLRGRSSQHRGGRRKHCTVSSRKKEAKSIAITAWLFGSVENRQNRNTKFIYILQKLVSDQNQLELKLSILSCIQTHINRNDEDDDKMSPTM